MTNSTTNHTPGPWRVHAVAGLIQEANGHSIAAYTGTSQDEADANARLIAAAPELLAALEHLLALNSGCAPEEEERGWDQARAAIAKATGHN